ncbi:MAG: M56 family metallopeptidase [Solirubrobacteraceae bacterium]
MSSARRLWWLHATLLGAGVLGLASALVAVARLVDFELPSASELAAACRGVGLGELNLASGFVILVGSGGLAAVVLSLRAAVRELAAVRRLRRALPVLGPGSDDNTIVIDAERPLAFCVGPLRPLVYVSRGALETLDRDEVTAVLAHEAHHAKRRDPLRLLVARSLAEGLFFLPGLRRLAQRYAALAEVAADEAAVRAVGSPKPLAAALLAFDAHPSPVAVGIAPERVDHLLGRRASWELPFMLLAASAATAGALLALSIRLATQPGHASVGLPELAAQACMLAMAAAPLVLGATALLGALRLARRS